MNEILTVREMKERYPGEWVLVGEPQQNPPSLQVVAGRVLAHSLDRDAVYAAMISLKPRHCATLCFAEFKPDVAILL